MKNCPHFLREAAGEAAAAKSFSAKGGQAKCSGGKFGFDIFIWDT